MNTTTTKQLELLAHLRYLNAKTAQWVAAGEGRGASYLSEDLQHWAHENITSVEDFDHDDLVTTVFESTRDVYGYKPSWSALMAMTNDELRTKKVRLSAAYAADAAYRDEQAKENELWAEEYYREQGLLAEAALVDAAEYFGFDR